MSVLILAKSHSRTNEQIFMKFFTVEFYWNLAAHSNFG
jgi:hypothetical protein